MDANMEELCKRMQTDVSPPSLKKKFQELFRSAQTGDLAAIEEMVNSLKEEDLIVTALQARDADGLTALHLAAAGGKKEVCKYLIEVGKVDINMKDWGLGETPLHRAISKGRFQMVVLLLNNGAGPNVRTKKRRTSLHYAGENDSKELMELLISKGADINAVADCGTPLQQAAGKGREGFVKLLLDHHADPNVISHNRCSPLLASIRAESIDCMELLLKAGADPNFSGQKGITPLGYAASEGLKDLVNCLLNAGADPNVPSNLGLTPIEAAAFNNKRRVVRILFPLTSPIQTIHNWSISGVFEHVKSDEVKEEMERKLKDRFLTSKSKGVGSFNRKDYFDAVQWFTELNEGGLAFEDASLCTILCPDWSEAHYRAGAALMLLKEFDKAGGEFLLGLAMDPENQILKRSLREAIKAQDSQRSI